MLFLFKIGLRHGKHYWLLFVTFIFMVSLTIANNAEILAVGVLTNRAGAAAKIAESSVTNPLDSFMAWSAQKFEWHSNLTMLAAMLILVAVVKAASLFGSLFTKQLVQLRVSRDMQERYFSHIQTLSMDFFHKYNVGNLVNRVLVDAGQIAAGVYAALTTYVQTPIMIASSLVACFFISVRLSLVMFVAFPILVLPILYFAKRLRRVAHSQQRLSESFMGTLVDLLAGMQTVKLFAMEAISLRKFRHYSDRGLRLAVKGARYGFLARPVLHLASTFMIAALMLYGLLIAKMSVPEILVFCGMVYLMYSPIKRLNDENQQIQKGIAAAERMQEVLAMKPQVADRPDAQQLTGFSDAIEFCDVWFRYGDDWILKGVSFRIERGQTVALVGPTGGGKSTIAQLLPRLYDPQKGQILYDGKPLDAYTQRSLRQQISFVPQKPYLFMDSVAENIAFGHDFSQAKIEQAGRRAHAHEFIEQLPEGYQTILTERGNSLSGGQQQRLAIARALVKDAPILVMDEATSSLDAVSESKIQQAVRELHGTMTQVLIAHRLSTVEDADKIIYIDGGEVLGQGTRDELLACCPPFRHMWDTMFKSDPVLATDKHR